MKKIIELQCDVTNPEKDRRSKDWNKLPVIPKGKRLLVSDTRDGFEMISAENSYAWDTGHSTLGRAILANSINVVPATVKELSFVHDCDYGGSEILRCLLKLGRITAADFAAVGKALNENENF